MADDTIEVTAHASLADIPAADWDACACPETADGGRPVDPFTTYRFLRALEDSRSVGTGTGWEPRHLVARRGGQVIAAAPLYAKSHSQGEYIFDHNWAHAYENAGGRYYPKLQIAVPFTPATGRRLLTRPGLEADGRAALVQGALHLASRYHLSSLHITFCTEDERAQAAELGLMPRSSQQFHWLNRGYDTFDDFLADLSSRKRKNIRKERATAQAFGGQIVALTGDDIRPEHWDAFWEFYQDTGARKWGTPYLTRAFFDRAQETLRDDMLLVLALRGGRPVAGALNFIGRSALYGRYWGAIEDHPCLHFECCYYQAIDAAIARGLDRVEAGAQGAHKLARGYLPVACHSMHWVADEGFARAVDQYLQAEAGAVTEEIEVLTAYGPFRRTDAAIDP
ncbi:GNAT family N-acetyltransferase [Meridianimarinicoccus roseus]|uniref:GNAT family N-acetyltransferase n=1 Tax=Meridianimarinicoccus roseus TaxID=2072018 RepID=A0A2V2LM02_9RHOB|nr:GNAT family N-acetyltransferase [Meridianimarinicoccus roseus]PWR02773.1 GNAT family N-acetyltransferase [Meridianimarinicoccus roseus]